MEFRSFDDEDLSIAFNVVSGETFVLSALADEIYSLASARSVTVEELNLFFFGRFPEVGFWPICDQVESAIEQLRSAGALEVVKP